MYRNLAAPLVAVALTASTFGCEDATDQNGGGETGQTESVTSCDWPDLGLCYEYVDYAGTEAWCGDMAQKYGIATNFFEGSCAPDSVASCALDIGGDLDAAATAFYYASFGGDPASACTSAGGLPG